MQGIVAYRKHFTLFHLPSEISNPTRSALKVQKINKTAIIRCHVLNQLYFIATALVKIKANNRYVFARSLIYLYISIVF